MDSIPATFEHGVFRPTEPVQLPEGCQVELSVVPLTTQPTEHSTATPPLRESIEDQLRRIADTVPAEEWERLPADLSDRLDHYIYQSKSE
jgi:predicted DNA-binding antitoxin AbrB/MazE fold protein